MSIVKLHPKFILRLENDAAYGIQGENQEKVKTRDKEEIFYLYLASLEKYNFSCPQLEDWQKKKIIIREKAKIKKLNRKKEKINLEKLMGERPEEYTQYPLMLTLGITNQCICSCRHCGNRSGPWSKTSMGLDKIKEIIDECHGTKLLKLTLTGGEPLVRDDILQIISYAKERIPRVSLTSNGILITRKMAQKLAESQISMVKISLDGLKDSHDNLRRYHGAYQSAIKAIKYLKASGVETRVQSTLLRKNQKDLLKLVGVTGQLGADVHTIVPLSPIGRASREDMLQPIEYYRFVNRFIEKIKNFQNKTIYQIRPVFNLDVKLGLKTLSTKYKCQALKNTIEIQAGGDIIPCSFFNLRLGNIYQDKLKDIWLAPKTDEIRAYFRPENLIGSCQKCIARESCGGGCLANAYTLYNRLYSGDVYCWKN